MKKSMNTVGHNIAMILRGHLPIEKTVKLIGMVTSVTFNNEEIIKELMKNDIYYLKDQFSIIQKKLDLNDNYDVFNKTMDKLLLMDVYREIEQIPSEEYIQLIDVYNEINTNDDFSTPRELGDLMTNIVGVSLKDKIYDPTFGKGMLFSSILQKNKDQMIAGYELNSETSDMAKIRMYLMGAQNITIVNDNALIATNKKIDETKYDLVISHPPFGIRGTNEVWHQIEGDRTGRYSYGIPSKTNADWAFIMDGISKLNETGKVVMLVSNSTLFKSGQSMRIRENFLMADLLEAVIALPAGLLSPITSIPTSLIIFNKNKKQMVNKVLMINASRFETIKNGNANALTEESYNKIISLYQEFKEESEISKLIPVQEIRQKEATLLPETYVASNIYKLSDGRQIEINQSKLSDILKVKLSDVAQIYRGYNVTAKEETDEGTYQLIKISDLIEGSVNLENLSRINAKENTKVENYQIEKGDILLSVRGLSEKLAYVTEDAPNTLITQNIVGIRANNQVNSKWLMKYLNSPLGLAQLASIKVGAAIAQIPLKALKELEIPLVDIQEQNDMINNYDKESEQLKQEYQEIMKKLKEVDQQLYKNMKINDLFELKN